MLKMNKEDLCVAFKLEYFRKNKLEQHLNQNKYSNIIEERSRRMSFVTKS